MSHVPKPRTVLGVTLMSCVEACGSFAESNALLALSFARCASMQRAVHGSTTAIERAIEQEASQSCLAPLDAPHFVTPGDARDYVRASLSWRV